MKRIDVRTTLFISGRCVGNYRVQYFAWDKEGILFPTFIMAPVDVHPLTEHALLNMP
jgi:hypothetical protein